LPDTKPSHTLYLMNLKGWTGFYPPDTKEEIDNYIDKGAQYLIYHGELSERYQFLEEYMKTQIGQFGNIAIYSLNDSTANFIEYTPEIDSKIISESSKTIIDNVKKGDLYLVSVNIESDSLSTLEIATEDPNQIFVSIKPENPNQEELKTFVYVHRNIKNERLTVTIKNNSGQDISFKDLTIIKIKDNKKVVL
ncbi:MAG: hypothetical protein KAR57_04560, partial [Bacteroidales bacterium]|nr:hypothetical protein [Bacteroidales bacterium]